MIGFLRDEKVHWKLAGDFGADATVGVESRKAQVVSRFPLLLPIAQLPFLFPL
jgi:hypothetical protein